ncbi:MAG: polymer-forming cytoskeletal protein [Thermomicrobiales bacterium]
MSGTVRCRGRLEIRSTGIVSDVRTGALVIHEGARYEGQIAMEAVEAAPAIESEDDPGESAVLETDEDSSETEYSFLRRFAPEDDDALPEDETLLIGSITT